MKLLKENHRGGSIYLRLRLGEQSRWLEPRALEENGGRE